MFRSRMIRFFIFVFLLCANCVAQREPVLKQIDLPHPYYYREMYLPQLSTGPSAAAWSPGSRTLIYSMAGSLWRQDVNSTVAEQLTTGPGYDYQPDWSADGRWVAFSRYDHDAIELWLLDLHDGRTRQLTSGNAVNLEPRFSPDGKRLAFVSTSYKGHFHIFAGRFEDGELSDVQQLTPENVSPLPRYYYSQVDHEISPVWSHDGSEILFISNRGHIHGTGGFWRMKAQPGAEAHEIHYEETTWKARPDFSPDGKRMVYASYLGRSWHQLWVMPEAGGDAFPISYGDYDNINPRWSPDGSKIAFVSNRSGNTSLWIQTIPGGAQNEVVARERKYLKPMGKLLLRVTDRGGKPVAARVFVTAEDGRAYAPGDAWMEADDSFDRKERRFEAHYFDTKGISEVTVPAGKVQVGVMRGFECLFEELSLEVVAGKTSEATVPLRLIEWKSPATRWASGDAHVHMNYAGTYRNTPPHLVEQAAAENLSIVENLVVNKEQRFPDIAYFSPKLDPASDEDRLLQHAQEFHTSYWGQLVAFDSKTLKVLHTWPLAPCKEPSGLAIDVEHKRLFAGCHNQIMAMVDYTDGKVVATVPIGSGVDANRFDPATGLAFASCGDGTITVAHEDSPDKLTVVQTITTQAGARTMALDTQNHNVYTVTADFGPPPPATPQNPHPWPKVISKTFTLLIFAQ